MMHIDVFQCALHKRNDCLFFLLKLFMRHDLGAEPLDFRQEHVALLRNTPAFRRILLSRKCFGEICLIELALLVGFALVLPLEKCHLIPDTGDAFVGVTRVNRLEQKLRLQQRLRDDLPDGGIKDRTVNARLVAGLMLPYRRGRVNL